MSLVKFAEYIPQQLVGVNSPSPTLAAEVVTGAPIATGARPGGSFYISSQLAAKFSTPFFPVFPGWYRVVQVDPAAVAANISFGAVGAQANITNALLDNNVTDLSKALQQGIAPCVFLTGGVGLLVSGAWATIAGGIPAGLAAMTPGNYTIVQDAGDTLLLVAAGQTVVVGSVLSTQPATPTGPVVVAGAISDAVYSDIVGIAEAAVTTPAALTLSAVAAASGGVAVYTGTITGGGANAFAGMQAVITGFTGVNTVDNGTFLITASTATTLTLVNPAAVAVTAAGTATLQALVRARLGFPFGQAI